MLLKFILLLLVADGAVLAQAPETGRDVPRLGVKEVQVPFASLHSSATLKIGGTTDWVLVTEDAVWVAGSKPYSVQRVDPRTNRIAAKVSLSGEACSGLELGFGSVWVPLCGKQPALVRISTLTNTIAATLPIAPAGAEGGVAASGDSMCRDPTPDPDAAIKWQQKIFRWAARSRFRAHHANYDTST